MYSLKQKSVVALPVTKLNAAQFKFITPSASEIAFAKPVKKVRFVVMITLDHKQSPEIAKRAKQLLMLNIHKNVPLQTLFL